MKKALVVLGVLCVLLAAGIIIFLVTFDADRYRPMLVSKLQEAIGRPVTLQRLSLGWRHGIALQLQGLSIAEPGAQGGEPSLQLESASALVRLVPLLRKELEMSSIVLTRPRVHIARDDRGRLNLFGVAAVAGPTAAAAPTPGSPVAFNITSFHIDDGTLHWSDALTNPPMELRVKRVDLTVHHIALGKPMDVDLKGAVGAEARNLHFVGRVTPPASTHPGSVEQAHLTLERLPLDQVLPPARPGEPQLRGTLTVDVQGGVRTLEPTQMAQAIFGRGRLKLDEAMIANLNVLRTVFEKFSMIPGLMDTLQARLPPTYQSKLAAQDTVFSPLDLSLQVEDGTLRFDELRVRADGFELDGSGRVGLDRTVNIRSTLRIEPSLSQALIAGVQELQALTNAEGRMEIPLVIQGQASRIAVSPDLHYIASKVVVTKVEDLLSHYLQKAIEKHVIPQAAPSQ